MTSLFHYLNWRGDLSLEQVKFNNVDALILSSISYIPFDDIISADDYKQITIGKAAELFFKVDISKYLLNSKKDAELFKKAAKTIRFRNMNLYRYVCEINHETPKQFAAMIIDTHDDCFFVSYRGTDQALIGWKEDFSMSFTTPVPSQEHAVEYLEHAAEHMSGNIRIGGHSKGGNLAVYAATFCSESTQRRIVNIYNYDGPGFETDILLQESYQMISNKIKTFVPQFSIVGLMFEHEKGYNIVSSTQTGLLQHSFHSWEVDCEDFLYVNALSNRSRFWNNTLKAWIAQMDYKQREQLVEVIFNIFAETKASTISELSKNWHRNTKIILKSIHCMDKSMKQSLFKTLGLFIKSARDNRVLRKL